MPIYIQIKQLTILNFRCYEQAQWNFSKRLNLLVGENGSGKTSILEAIYLMAYGRSFRQSKDAAWQQWGTSHFQIDGQWQRYGPLNLHIQ
ncbi:MAG: AAA family ATPase, partial [Mariprofundaceae bacterium]|nr:AAA family ATPase [Mariprofundaceae bacterium]